MFLTKKSLRALVIYIPYLNKNYHMKMDFNSKKTDIIYFYMRFYGDGHRQVVGILGLGLRGKLVGDMMEVSFY